MINKLKEWVNENYISGACEYTEERSMGNSSDVFWDGHASGVSTAAYEVGVILGMFSAEEDSDEVDGL